MNIKTVGIVGCGLMGAGIAQTVAESGCTTIVRELTPELVEKGLGRIRVLSTKVLREQALSARRDQVWRVSKARLTLAGWRTVTWLSEAIVEVRDAS